MRLGLATGGGDCPGLNAAIRAVVKHAVGVHGIEVIGIRDGLTGLSTEPNRIMPLDLVAVQDLIDVGGTVLGTSNKGSPFREKAEADKTLKTIARSWKKLRLDALCVIGGDGTHFMARRLVDEGYPVVGIPKTIDNDLVGCDWTIGFSTAVDTAADAAAKLASSAKAHDRAMILEVMGRDAGHIALHAGLAAGAHAILLPEIPFAYEVLAERIKARKKLGAESYLIVVAEGAHHTGGERSYKAIPGKVLGGISSQIADEVMRRTGVEARATVLGHVQRGGTPNATDRILASRFGVHAVSLIAAKKFGSIVAVRDDKMIEIPYSDVDDARRLVDPQSELVRIAEATGVTFGRKASARKSDGVKYTGAV